MTFRKNMHRHDEYMYKEYKRYGKTSASEKLFILVSIINIVLQHSLIKELDKTWRHILQVIFLSIEIMMHYSVKYWYCHQPIKNQFTWNICSYIMEHVKKNAIYCKELIL